MFMLLVAIPALLTVWALAGRPAAFLDHRWRGLSLIWASLAVQVVLFSPLGEGIPEAVVPYAHVATYLPLLAFLILNRGAALGLVAVGVALNVVAIVANGGFMPGDPAAQEVFFADRGAVTHALNVDNVSPRLLFLGDVMALPDWAPFANAFSIGDLVMALGLVWAMARLSLHRLGPPPAAAAAPARIDALGVHLAGWIALGVAFTLIPVTGVREVAGVLIVGFAVRWACLHRSAGFARSRGLLGIVAVLLVGGAATSSVSSTVAALLAAAAAGAMSTRALATGGGLFTADWGLGSVLPMLASAGGIATGAILGRLIPAWAGLAVAAVIAVSAMVTDRGVLHTPSDIARGAPAAHGPGARLIVSGVAAAAGFASLAAFVVVTHQAGLPAAGLGLLVAAWIMGVLFGVKMAAALAVPPTTSAGGLAVLFAGAAGALLATAHLPMTVIAAATVLGIATGAGLWLNRSAIGEQYGWTGRLAVVGGLLAALIPGTDSLPEALVWISAASCLVGVAMITTRIGARSAVRTRVASQ